MGTYTWVHALFLVSTLTRGGAPAPCGKFWTALLCLQCLTQTYQISHYIDIYFAKWRDARRSRSPSELTTSEKHTDRKKTNTNFRDRKSNTNFKNTEHTLGLIYM